MIQEHTEGLSRLDEQYADARQRLDEQYYNNRMRLTSQSDLDQAAELDYSSLYIFL
jgi:hypothetical protein